MSSVHSATSSCVIRGESSCPDQLPTEVLALRAQRKKLFVSLLSIYLSKVHLPPDKIKDG